MFHSQLMLILVRYAQLYIFNILYVPSKRNVSAVTDSIKHDRNPTVELKQLTSVV